MTSSSSPSSASSSSSSPASSSSWPAAWTRFWFARAPSDSLALARIFLGVSCVLRFTGFYGFAARIVMKQFAIAFPIHRFTDSTWRFTDMPVKLIDAAPTLTLADYNALEAAALWLGVAFMLGIAARITGPLLAAALLASQLFDEAAFKHHIFTLGLAVLVVGLSPCSDRFSVDALLSLRGRRSIERSVLPVRLLQVMVSGVYFFSWNAKLNSSWWNGFLFAYGARHHGAESSAVVAAFTETGILESLVWPAAAWGTLVVELFLVFGFWNKRLLPYAISAGIGLHAVIELSFDVGSFSSTMIALYCAFLPVATRARLVRVRTRGQAVLVRALDWAARFDVVEAPASSTLAVLERDGAVVVEGSAALWHVVERLPLTTVFGMAHRVVVAISDAVARRRRRAAA